MPHTDMKTAAHWPALETELLIWVTERQQHGVVVSTTELRLKAIHLSKQAPNCQQFCVSVDWWYDFLRRHSFLFATEHIFPQKLPADYDKLTQYQSLIINTIKS